jgi:antitoxin MazE
MRGDRQVTPASDAWRRRGVVNDAWIYYVYPEEQQVMQVRIAKWGNSLAVRLPRAITDDLGLAEGQSVDIGIEDGSVRLKPSTERVRLSDLIAEAERLGSAAHPEVVAWGADVGAETIDDAYSKPRRRSRRAKQR